MNQFFFLGACRQLLQVFLVDWPYSHVSLGLGVIAVIVQSCRTMLFRLGVIAVTNVCSEACR